MTPTHPGFPRRLGRAWLYLWLHVLLAVAGLVELILSLVVTVLAVLISVAFLGLRPVFALVAATADWAGRLAAWVRYTTPPGAIGQGGSPGGLTGLLRSRRHWRAHAWLALNFLALPVHLAAIALFPLARLWAVGWAKATTGLLREPAPRPAAAYQAQTPPPHGGGHGLVGMRERVAALGGVFRAGPTADGGFEVRAMLPLPERPDPSPELPDPSPPPPEQPEEPTP
ncbi:MAG: hypothetical protein LBR27_06285 [Bifidobacteriaceae bacterium]|jgi:hypothetical protein|nr:hypothetical protein [Bifidobacteriaceae bacterium]